MEFVDNNKKYIIAVLSFKATLGKTFMYDSLFFTLKHKLKLHWDPTDSNVEYGLYNKKREIQTYGKSQTRKCPPTEARKVSEWSF